MAIAVSLSVVLLVAVGVIFMWCICVRVRHSHNTAKLPTGPLPDRRSVRIIINSESTCICHIIIILSPHLEVVNHLLHVHIHALHGPISELRVTPSAYYLRVTIFCGN